MSKINIFALGGLNEIGKNMYVVEIDKDIFVFDSGLKYADDNMLGVDYILPDYTYLKNNENRIKGIFVTNGHDEHIGALPDMLRDLTKTKVYGTKFTLDILKEELIQEGLPQTNLVESNPHQKIKVGKYIVFPIRLSNDSPDTVGYVLYTKDGAIVYTGNFVFDSTLQDSYKTDIGKLAYVGKQGVLCLLAESTFAEKRGFTSPNHRSYNFFKEIIYKKEKRILINIYQTQNYRINDIFNAISETDRKVVILGKRLEKSILSMIEQNYLNFDRKRISSIHNIKEDNVVVLISDEREKPFSNIKRIVKGYDKFITLNSEDTIIFASPIHDGTERSATKLFDDIAKLGCDLIPMSSKKYLALHASSEDLMMMLSLLNPKYYFPVIGEYRHQVANSDVAKTVGYNDESIVLSINGQVTTFVNGKLVPDNKNIKVDEILIDGKTLGDIGEIVIKDREMLGESGIVLINAVLDKKTKEIIYGPEIVTKGFVYMKENEELIIEATKLCQEAIKDNTKTGYADYSKIKNQIRDKVGKYFYQETESKPVILTTVHEI